MLLRQLRRGAIVLLAAASCAAMAAGAVKNKPPTVALTSPANGATFNAPATVPLAATASDADGTVAKVEFFRGKTLIGTATAAPYNFTWANVAAGTYSITAKATDNAGGATTSTAVSITVFTATNPPPPPQATTITSPAPGAALPLTITDVSGTFSGPADTTVLVSNGANGTVLATLTGTATFVARNVPLVQGANTLRATAIRRDGTSSSGSVTVDVPQRLVVLTSPTRDTTYQSPPSLTFQASALLSSGSVQRIDYYEHSPFTGSVTRLGTATVPPFTFVWNSPPKGTHNVYAWLLDDKNIGRQSTEIQFTVAGPNVPPSVSLTAPANNATFAAPASFALQASATDSDGSVSLVEFLQNGQLLGSTNVARYGFALSNLGVGAYSFAARATDDKGATTTSAPVAVNVAAPPQVSLSTSAASGRIQAGGSVTLTADASSAQGSIARVEFYANGALVGSATAAPYSFTWTNVPVGAYQLTAKAIDNSGLATTSAPVALSAVPGPNVGLTSPAPGASYFLPASINLAADANSTSGNIVSVAFFDNGTPIGTATAAPFTLLWSNASAGSHALTAVATDEQGFSSTSTVVNVTVVSASLTIASPLSGASVPNTGVLVRGHISAPKYSGVVVNGQIAYVDASGDFYANDVVPLSEDNGIHVALSTPDEVQVTATVVVTPVAPAPTSTDLKIGDTETVGLIKAVWTLKNPVGVRDVTFDYWGDGTVILKLSDDPGYVPGGTGKTITLPYSGYGVFKPIVTVEDMLGNIYRKQFVLQARSVAEIDTMVKDLWARMLGKLKAADIPGALTAVTGAGRQRFQAIFENLQPNPAAAVDQLGTLTGSQFGVDSAEYLVIRQKAEGPTGYPIYFIRSNDGVWRVDAM